MKNLQFEDGKMIPASKYFSSGESSSVELNEDEMKIAAEIKASLPKEASGEARAVGCMVSFKFPFITEHLERYPQQCPGRRGHHGLL